MKYTVHVNNITQEKQLSQQKPIKKIWRFIDSNFLKNMTKNIVQTSAAVWRVRKEVGKCDEVQRALNCKLLPHLLACLPRVWLHWDSLALVFVTQQTEQFPQIPTPLHNIRTPHLSVYTVLIRRCHSYIKVGLLCVLVCVRTCNMCKILKL